MANRAMTIHERLSRAVRIDEAGCWRWGLRRDRDGYGRITVTRDGRPHGELAHRVAFAEWCGSIPPGLEVDHLCRVRDCIRPDHLEAVTGPVNKARRVGADTATLGAFNGLKTHCPDGHPYDEANTYVAPASGFRNCRACRAGKYLEAARRRAK